MKSKMHKLLNNPALILLPIYGSGLLNWLPDKQYLSIVYKSAIGKKIDFENPQTYNEKLQWLKLYDRKPEYVQLVDKYRVREFVKSRIGDEYLIPLLGVWDNANDIDFDMLPQKFVLKCNHDSGSVIICKDKNCFDFEKARKKLNKHLKMETFSYGREWPYKNVKRCIVCEAFMEDEETNELRDYKFFTFNGEPKVMFIATDRQNETKDTAFDFFDMDYKHLDLRHGHPNAPIPPVKPQKFDEMIYLARVLSEGIPQLRVDFYQVNGKIYFGELTFFHHAGFTPFDPPEWDLKFGSWIKLPEKRS